MTASDGTNTTNQTLTINISNVTEVTVVNDSKTGNEDDSVRVLVLANDTLVGTPTLTANNGSNGTVSVQSDAATIAEYGNPTVIFTPNANWNGSDSFTYTVSAGGESGTATVAMTYNPVNDNPVINSSTFNVDENKTTIGTLDATDVDGDLLIYTSLVRMLLQLASITLQGH